MTVSLQRKAYYNLILLKLANPHDKTLNRAELKEFMKENYRDHSLEELFKKLQALDVEIAEVSEFEAKASEYDTPEEMTQTLATHSLIKELDALYLVVFELWRRVCQERPSISIFCDELDHQITMYLYRKVRDSEKMQDCLAELERILDENLDREALAPPIVLEWIQSYLAHHLIDFLYDYILDRIEEQNEPYAKDLLDGFYHYIDEKSRPWFDYLLARAEILNDPEEGYRKLEELALKLALKPQFLLEMEILSFLAESGHHSLFSQVATQLLPQIEVEAEFLEFANYLFMHTQYLQLRPLANEIESMLRTRGVRPEESILSKVDSDLLMIKKILSQKVHFANTAVSDKPSR